MKTDFTREEIRATLVERYRIAYAGYLDLERTARDMLREEDVLAYERVHDLANLRSNYLFGMRTAAVALGIPEKEFMEAVAQEGGTEHENEGA